MIALGLDLSLSAAGAVAIPFDWGGDFSRVARHHVGHSLPKTADETRRIGRLHQSSSEILSFAERHRCSTAIIEEYAFAARFSHAHALGELGGAVKLALLTRAGIIVETVHAAKARKLLLGKVPRSDVKSHVREKLIEFGMPRVWTDDEMDALVVGQWLVARGGGFAYTTPEPIEEKRTRRRAA